MAMIPAPEDVRRRRITEPESISVDAVGGEVWIRFGDVLVLSPEQAAFVRDRIAEAMADLDVCEHGIRAGDWCQPCNEDYKSALSRAAGESG